MLTTIFRRRLETELSFPDGRSSEVSFKRYLVQLDWLTMTPTMSNILEAVHSLGRSVSESVWEAQLRDKKKLEPATVAKWCDLFQIKC